MAMACLGLLDVDGWRLVGWRPCSRQSDTQSNIRNQMSRKIRKYLPENLTKHGRKWQWHAWAVLGTRVRWWVDGRHRDSWQMGEPAEATLGFCKAEKWWVRARRMLATLKKGFRSERNPLQTSGTVVLKKVLRRGGGRQCCGNIQRRLPNGGGGDRTVL